ncbi:MAG: hypothetical protein Q8M07_07040 [Prosthecobacter sp.]|nr:hypothetical protein [Prosthecobacter sp.]
MKDILVSLHEYQTAAFAAYGGQHWFLIESLLIAAAICRWGIPITTDLMVNASAGLAGKHFGDKSRTLVINASTNNPELANMMVSLGIGRAGGIANPLGSNFANMYLMFLVAPLWLLIRWSCTGQSAKAGALISLLIKEKKLVISHVFMALLMFGFASLAYWFMTGFHQFARQPEGVELRPWNMLLLGAGICVVGVFLFRLWDKSMQRKRPELFDDIESGDHLECWKTLLIGTGGLIIVSFILNGLFLAWSDVYATALKGVFGSAVFAGLHYFAGALVTSLPELKVATDNYEKLSSPDLNTALSSASVSNMTNLAIAILGVTIIGILSALGMTFTL